PPIVGNVDFKDVYFRYEEGVDILKGINFHVDAGESIALVGPTGAGKTTIINLLSRFYNINSGEILVDGENVEEVTLRSLRSQMGVMLQDTFIFSGTIIENIRYGKLDATEEEIIAAAKVVRAHDFISGLKDGYYTEVKERGSTLSAGQRQLISFARALLADPKILILDEATSSIDTQTEILLQEGLERLLEGRTSFIIAHRLSTIKNSSRIFYIDNGRIQEAGSHEELMAQHGYYYNLYQSQFDMLQAL
ncbi:ATP-binding cassette domain-containing protein, partial [Listeria monocytogenes]|nr:ATP-binding cassette domain-containing protein [Listeria monocytogenes]